MAHTLIEATAERFMLAELHRPDAALAPADGDAAAVEASLRLSLAVAEDQGRTAEARALLLPILDRIDEGDCAPHRAAAQALLAGLPAAA